MTLYECSLFNIFEQLNAGKILYNELYDLPYTILDNLDMYLIHIDESYEDFIETAFYTSLKLKHLLFAKYFLLQITLNINDFDFIEIVNNGLSYVTDIESVEFLIKYGANNFNQGLLGSVFNNNMIMIKYFINLGADNFNRVMLQATIKNNITMIKYFINLGANDFNEGLFMATRINNMKLIKFFIKKGATNFNGGLYVAAFFGFDNLILFYNNLGANDYIIALGGAIDNNHFNDLLIPVINKINPCVVGEAFLYFLKNTNFESMSGNNINHLIPYLLEGYATKQTLMSLLKLYVYNKSFNHIKDNSYYIAFGKMPSLNVKVIRNGKTELKINEGKSNTFDNIKKYHSGFYLEFIDKLYFPDIIELNIYKNNHKDDKLFLTNNETKKQLWKEQMIIKAVVDFYDQ